ncbi:MAG TPA: winged helix-turn-helix domain-containing protein [Candidatus Nanoarchaeia archaeon]|nr:winged helix-turn-helix domain-containing protein [Candidatus Nanoarchaeia archaeon]
MRYYKRKITIINIQRPAENINQELQWFGHSLGLFSERDKDKSCFRIFIELLKAAKLRHPLTSDELGYHLKLTRGTIIHHINTLMGSGLVLRDGNRYLLRVDNLSELTDEIEEDLLRSFRKLKAVAEKLDDRMGL